MGWVQGWGGQAGLPGAGLAASEVIPSQPRAESPARLVWLGISKASLCTGTVSGRKYDFSFCCNLKEGGKKNHKHILPLTREPHI